ncbi:MAG: hypothetical protein GY698_24040 [Actinomycetia bacterium]|nr:hypothetical protein [Actinomycetes bacterium]
MRPIRILLASVVLAATAAIVDANAAAASTNGCNELTGAGTDCGLEDILPPAPGSGPLYVNDGRVGPFYSWFATALPCLADTAGPTWSALTNVGAAFNDLPLLTEATLAEAIAALEGQNLPADELAQRLSEIDGRLWFAELIQPDGTPTGTGLYGCVGPLQTLPQPPRPPSPEEVWGAALTFEPEIHLDPQVRGLVGLETFLWYQGPTTGTINPPLVLRGYGLTAEIEAFQFEWDLGAQDRDGNRLVTATTPGIPDDPAGSHTFAEPADVAVTHTVYWTGTYTVTGPGFPPGGLTFDLGVAAIVVSRDYQVIEIRTPVVPGG